MKIWFQPCFAQMVVGFIAAFESSVLRNVRPHEAQTELEGLMHHNSYPPSPMRQPWFRTAVAMDIVVFRRHVQDVGPKTDCSFLLELEEVGEIVSALVLRQMQTTWLLSSLGLRFLCYQRLTI